MYLQSEHESENGSFGKECEDLKKKQCKNSFPYPITFFEDNPGIFSSLGLLHINKKKKGCDYITDEEKTHMFYLISKVPWLNFY